MASRCARCGSTECHAESARTGNDPVWCYEAAVECRNRELANLQSLLRSVTIKLEKAHQLCTDDYPKSAAGLIEQVLEVLS